MAHRSSYLNGFYFRSFKDIILSFDGVIPTKFFKVAQIKGLCQIRHQLTELVKHEALTSCE